MRRLQFGLFAVLLGPMARADDGGSAQKHRNSGAELLAAMSGTPTPSQREAERAVSSAQICWAEVSRAAHEKHAAAAELNDRAAEAKELRARAQAARAVATEARKALQKTRSQPLSCKDPLEETAERCLYSVVDPEARAECVPYLRFIPPTSVLGPGN